MNLFQALGKAKIRCSSQYILNQTHEISFYLCEAIREVIGGRWCRAVELQTLPIRLWNTLRKALYLSSKSVSERNDYYATCIGEQCLGLGTTQDCLIKCAHAFSSYFHHTDEDSGDGNSAPSSRWQWRRCKWRNNGSFAFSHNKCQMFNSTQLSVLSHLKIQSSPV